MAVAIIAATLNMTGAQAGPPMTGELPVATVPLLPSDQAPYVSAVAASADGRFVVAWHDAPRLSSGLLGRVMVQRHTAAGIPVGTPIEALSSAESRSLAIGMDALGNFAVVSFGTVENGVGGVVARSFGADGTPRGPALLVGSTDDAPPGFTAPGLFVRPSLYLLDGLSLTMASDGGFAVAWRGHFQSETLVGLPRTLLTLTFASRDYIQLRAYSAEGQPRSPVRTVHTEQTGTGCGGLIVGKPQIIGRPIVAARSGGGYAVAWRNSFLQCGQQAPALPPFSMRDYAANGAAESRTRNLDVSDGLSGTFEPGVDDFAFTVGPADDRWVAWSALPIPGQPDFDAEYRTQRVSMRRFLASGKAAGPSRQAVAQRREQLPMISPVNRQQGPFGIGLSLSATTVVPGVVMAWADDADEQVRARYYGVPAAGVEGAIQPREAAFDVGSYADYSARSQAQGWRASVGTATGPQDQLIAIWSAVKARLFAAP